ncbi:MFS general substrate transporter [Sistotremastrum niveocremeum HHB9708]|uniref:MFS general substrate transporter n=1 Tax=Sistotremastrum niveocremeum HHB9708 TaxID=1314777 RepID=A0A164M8Y6_9AGAM|nr:MFS general substrate transporter [Sistotremastrum niveocremeum HHB9708]
MATYRPPQHHPGGADPADPEDAALHNVDRTGLKGGLEEYERNDGRPPFVLTWTEVKLLGIAGVGFFLDAYDLFIINVFTVQLQYRLYGGHALPTNLQGFVNASANIGSVIGQFSFGYLADSLGRKAIYGKELMIIILATILTISAPTDLWGPPHNHPNRVLIWIACCRILLGIGVGADYPMSSSVTSDRAVLRKRGSLLAYVFANQGWGSLVGSLVTMITLLAYKGAIEKKSSKVDGSWRVIVGLSLVPAFGTLYQRLTLPESTRFKESQKVRGADDEEDEEEFEKKVGLDGKRISDDGEGTGVDVRPAGEGLTPATTMMGKEGDEDAATVGGPNAPPAEGLGVKAAAAKKKAHFREFLVYFSEWRHAKTLIGTCFCWFFLDIAFYGINLNQSVVLQQIGFAGKGEAEWTSLFHIATGNLIITALGFVPGYYVTVLTIEYLGRKWIQVQGFLMAALFLGILAGKFTTLSIPAFVVCFALLQFFFNFGANATTFIYPAEVFPTRVRATAHGMSAACGKAGAIISSLAFNSLSKKIGTPNVLWIFFGCCLAGACFTMLLPEVKGRDPDLVDLEEIRERRVKRRGLLGRKKNVNGGVDGTNGI